MNTERKGAKQGISAETNTIKPYNEIQLFFLLRIQRLLRVRRENNFPADDKWSKLLSKAIYSTYCDCIELNVGDDARSLLKKDKTAAQNPNS